MAVWIRAARADKCDCRLTLAAWTIAELIRLMNVGRAVNDALGGEDRAGKIDLFEEESEI